MSIPEGMPNPEMETRKQEQLPGRVYFVESNKDGTVVFALDVKYSPTSVRWFDGTKERRMEVGEITDADPNHFVFKRSEAEGGGEYSFVPMNLDVYNTKVKERLVAGGDFDDEETMLKAFESTKESAW